MRGLLTAPGLRDTYQRERVREARAEFGIAPEVPLGVCDGCGEVHATIRSVEVLTDMGDWVPADYCRECVCAAEYAALGGVGNWVGDTRGLRWPGQPETAVVAPGAYIHEEA